jgi:50S ribosomal protein L16 3-hydroxylase
MTFENFHCLGDISVEDFLTQYWQKKPLLIRNAFPGIQSPITAEELAGLACEDNINARLVLEKDGDYPWQAEHGPFDESRFAKLPETHWSLLISDMEKCLPGTASLVKPFRFLPDWRLDDLMISYAPTGGSVGAHVDDYDVFLIQLNGQRLWQISEHYSDETLTDVDLRILKNFSAEREWLCNPGDLLYLPPGVAHHGVAQTCKNEQGDNEHCMTASVGFRAPSLKTITSDYVFYLNENSHGVERFTDKSPVKPVHHAEITDDTISQFIEYLKQGITLEHEQVKRWLGEYSSDNKAFEDIEQTHNQKKVNFEQLCAIAAQSNLMRSPYSHFLFSYTDKTALLFVNGESFKVSKQFAETLCEDEHLDFQQLVSFITSDDKIVLLQLYNDGSIFCD